LRFGWVNKIASDGLVGHANAGFATAAHQVSSSTFVILSTLVILVTREQTRALSVDRNALRGAWAIRRSQARLAAGPARKILPTKASRPGVAHCVGVARSPNNRSFVSDQGACASCSADTLAGLASFTAKTRVPTRSAMGGVDRKVHTVVAACHQARATHQCLTNTRDAGFVVIAVIPTISAMIGVGRKVCAGVATLNRAGSAGALP